jgi:hypothetical protein
MDFLTNIDGSNAILTPKGIILGNVQFESNLPVPNCMLIFKYYLYVCKLKEMLPNLNAGLQYLNSEIKMEKYSAFSLSPSVVGDCFNMKWQHFEVALAYVHGLNRDVFINENEISICMMSVKTI